MDVLKHSGWPWLIDHLLLREYKVLISMTDSGEGYENQIAERVNGILKTEFKLHPGF